VHPPCSISVIIPVHNGEAYLREAIESVLSQGFPALEVIVVDDGSTDQSRKIAECYGPRVRCIPQENMGTAAARNRGVQVAGGAFFSFLDQDDRWKPRFLQTLASALGDRSDLDAAFAHMQQFRSPEIREDVRTGTHCPSGPQPGVLPSGMLIRREAFFRVGWFQTGWHLGEWTDWCIRAWEAGLRIERLPEVLFERRIHNRNKGLLLRSRRMEYLQILKASLDRRRSVIEAARG
jgi:glycosyltransferase involved in cell wall biosynthesis